MRKFLFVMTLIFVVLSFIGAGYVFYTAGQANAGYAVIPLFFCLACLCGYIAIKRKEEKRER